MNATVALGVVLYASPFVILALIAVRSLGWRPVLAAIAGCVSASVLLGIGSALIEAGWR